MKIDNSNEETVKEIVGLAKQLADTFQRINNSLEQALIESSQSRREIEELKQRLYLTEIGPHLKYEN